MNSDIKRSTDEKQRPGDVSQAPEHPETVQEKEYQTSTPNGSDLENHAVKGDDSDGKIVWTPKTLLATICLSGLYVGTSSSSVILGMALLKICSSFRLSDSPILCWWISIIYCRRYWRCGNRGMDASIVCSGARSSCSVLWLSTRPNGPPIYYAGRWLGAHHWYHCHSDSKTLQRRLSGDGVIWCWSSDCKLPPGHCVDIIADQL